MTTHGSVPSAVDVAVVGAGAAGLSAALVLGRARRSVLVLDGGAPRNAPAAHMHGFLSRDGLAPADLLAVGRSELDRYGVRPVSAGARSAAVAADGTFSVELTTGVDVRARALVVATGLTDSIPDVDGLWERWGRDVLHCPYCHGWEVRDEALLVVGRNRGALEQALLVRQWSADVTLLTDGTQPAAEDRRRLRTMGVAVDDRPLQGAHIVDDRLAGVRTSGGAIVPGNAVFVRPTLTPNDALLRKLGCDTVDGAGTVSVDRSGATSVLGVFAAGNVVDVKAQVITAAGAGSAAAIAANQYLTDRDIADRLR